MRCIIYHPNALHQLFYCILRSTNYNKPALFTSQKCGWILEYQFLSVRHEPWTSFPQEPAARSPPAYLTSNITLGIQQTKGFISRTVYSSPNMSELVLVPIRHSTPLSIFFALKTKCGHFPLSRTRRNAAVSHRTAVSAGQKHVITNVPKQGHNYDDTLQKLT